MSKKPTPKEQLDFLVMIACWPYAMWMSHDDGKGRGKGNEWLLSYAPKDSYDRQHHTGCVYAPTKEAVILTAMRLFEAQTRAAKMVKDAAA